MSLFKHGNQYFSPITLAFQIDENVNVVTREVYTFTDALSRTGGFLGLINIAIAILIGSI